MIMFPHLKPHTVPLIPPEAIPAPWQMTFWQLQQFQPLILQLPDEWQQRLWLEQYQRLITLYWVVKKAWQPRLKIPISPYKLRLLFESRGELFYQALRLCEGCHAVIPASHPAYPHPDDWFRAIVMEVWEQEENAILTNTIDQKSDTIKDRRQILRMLKERNENPVNSAVYPHFYYLLEVARPQSERDEEFHRQFYRPFIEAASRWTADTESSKYQVVFLKGDRICTRPGVQGRGVITLY